MQTDQTGRVVGVEQIKRPTQQAPDPQIEGGGIIRTCNITVDSRCLLADLTDARLGDRLEVRVRLHDPFNGSLRYIKVQMTLGSPVEGIATVYLQLEWPNVAGSVQSFTYLMANTRASLGENPARRLAYVPGSSELLDESGSRIARLPDTHT